MTEANKNRIEELRGLVSEQRRLGSFPDIQQSLLTIEEALNQWEARDERTELNQETLGSYLIDLDDKVRQLLRIARTAQATEFKKKDIWKLR